MISLKHIRGSWREWLDESRLHLSRRNALLHLAALGLITGLGAGVIIVGFRLLVEDAQEALLPAEGPENYEALSEWGRLLLPLASGMVLATLFRWGANGQYVLGVPRVLERMLYHQGHLTVRDLILQFWGATTSIIGGHSVGREGPHIFLGAATGSLLGQRLSLPNNAIRTLVGCGTAAGIAASFNTPLAGVVFAFEVMMMEYSVASFIPVILAAVSATTLSNAVFGTDPAFAVPSLKMASLFEMTVVIFLGVAAGSISALFIHLVQTVTFRTRHIAIWWRMLLAGGLVGLLALPLPDVMGIGYDTVQRTLHGEIGIGLLLALLLGKLMATSLSIGTGVPGGMIGPALFIGASLGALMGELAKLLPLGVETPVGFFAMVGMGAMMSGSLQAPLAALTAMLELTDNPEIILPGMLAVVVAGLTASELFRKESLFVTMLKASGLHYNENPVLQALRQLGVASVMDRNFVQVNRELTRARAQEIIAGQPNWLLVGEGHRASVLMPAVELAKCLEWAELPSEDSPIDLFEIPGERFQAEPIQLQQTLQEALQQFEHSTSEALFVERTTAPGVKRIYGVLTRPMVETAYRY